MRQDFSGYRKVFLDKKITFLLVVLVVLVGSVFAVNQRLVWKKSAEGDGATSSLAGCRLIPSSLYGAPKEEWSKYECVDGVAKLKPQTLLTGADAPKDETLVENLQVPSIKSFASSVQTGDAIVSYPIEVPPAAGGFIPSISLNYSSSTVADMRFNSTDDQWKNGWSWSQGSYAGLGWNLSGISQIFQNSAGRYYLIVDGRSLELEGTDGFNNQSEKVTEDLVYTSKPNSHLKIIRKYKNPDVSYPSTKTSLGNTAADYRSWDVWTKDGKHYHFEPLGFIPKYTTCTVPALERNWEPIGGDCDCSGHGGDASCKNILRKRDFNKWVLTEVNDTSNNKIVYEYNPPVNWENVLATGGYDNIPDVCREKCHDDKSKSWETCTSECFGVNKNIDDNPIELAYQDSGFSDVTFYQARVLYPRAIYPVSIKYGVGVRETDNSKTNKIEFVYSKREDNNYGWNRSSGDRKLEEIKVYLGSNLLRSYKLEYDYSQPGLDNPWDSYLGDSSVKKGQLLLKSVKVNGTAGETFPIFQTYEYHPKDDMDQSLLLKTAHNGYGASVDYSYKRDLFGVYWELFNPGNDSEDSDRVGDGGDSNRHRRPRLVTKTTQSSFSTSQQQKTEYSYLADNPNSNCGDNTETRDCHMNGHATLFSSGDFEFLGYSRVKEELSSSDDGGGSWTKQLATYYNFNPGGYDPEKLGQSWVFYTRDSRGLPYFAKKGTLARKTTVKFENGNEIPVSVDNMSYATTNVSDSAFNNIFFTQESKSCSDLDVTTNTLRRGGFASLPITPDNVSSIDDYFDRYGNSIKQEEHIVNGCGADFSNGNYYPTVNVNSLPYRTTSRWYTPLINDTTYIVDRPNSEMLSKANGEILRTSWFFYDGYEGTMSTTENPHQRGPINKGLLTASVTFEPDKIKKEYGGSIRTINAKTEYNDYGNPIKTISYSDYGSFVKTAGEWKLRLGNWPTDKRETLTAYDQGFQAFPKSVTGPVFSNGSTNVTTTVYDFETGSTPILGLPVGSRDPNGLETRTVYDSFGRITQKFSPGDTIPTIKYTYYDCSDLTHCKSSNGTTDTHIPNSNMAVKVEKKDVEGRYLSSYTFYDDLGKKLQTQSQSTNPAKMFADETKYDSLGRPFKQIGSMERAGTLGTYLNINVDSPAEYVTKTTYDSQGRAIRVKNPDGTCSVAQYEGKKTYAIDPMKNLASVEDGKFETRGGELRSIKTAIAYDGGSVLGAAVSNESIFAKINRYISTSTRAVKQLTGVNLCEEEIFSYPTLNITNIYTKQETETNVLGQTVVSSVFDGAKPPNSPKLLSQTTSAYDGFGRATQTFDPDLGTNKILAYNALGQALKTEDNNKIVRSTVYDNLGRVIKTYEGDCYGTALNCTPTSLTVLKSQMTYDLPAYGTALGKLVEEKTPGIISKEYFYQGGLGAGQNIGLLSKTKYNHSLIRESGGGTGTNLTEETTYDEAGRIKTTSYTAGVGTFVEWRTPEILTNQYDSIGRLKLISSNLKPDWSMENYPLITDISYNQFGLPFEKKLGNGVIETFIYDEAGKTLRLKKHTASKDGKDYLSLDYNGYDNVGNIKGLKDNKLGEAAIKYEYDNFYRLVGVSGPYSASYDYDELSRMTKKNEKENLSYEFSSFTDIGGLVNYYPLNAPKKVNGTSLEYTNGNLTKTVAGLNLTYDSQNRLIRTENDKSVTKYVYDAGGQRVMEVEYFANSNRKITSYVGNTEIIAEAIGGPNTSIVTYKRHYPFGGLRTIKRTYNLRDGSWSEEKNLYSIFTDHLSSTKAIVDQNGVDSLSKIDYYPYGSTRLEAPPIK